MPTNSLLTLVPLITATLLAAMPAHAQTPQPQPDWNLTTVPSQTAPAPPATTLQRRQLPRPQQPMPSAAGADAATMERSSSAMPDGYRMVGVPPAPATASPGHDMRAQSQLPETAKPLDQQVAILRKRMAELIRQMDDMQVRMVVSEQTLANHRHSYSYPNMGFISVESYNSYLERQQRNGQPVPFFSGSMMSNTTSLSVVPK